MKPQPEEVSRVHAELLVLRAMCQGTAQGSVRAAATRILKDYHWREPAHQAMFHSLVRLPGDNPEVPRSELPACLTRRGFPDIDWETLFTAHSLTKQEAERLMRQLKKSLAQRSTKSRE